MPRPDKPINPGRLDDEVSSSRAHAWTKYGETSGEAARGAPSEIEITVDDLTVADEHTPEPLSKFDQRGTSARVEWEDGNPVQPKRVRYEEEWHSVRSVDDRTYRRADTMEIVEVPL